MFKRRSSNDMSRLDRKFAYLWIRFQRHPSHVDSRYRFSWKFCSKMPVNVYLSQILLTSLTVPNDSNSCGLVFMTCEMSNHADSRCVSFSNRNAIYRLYAQNTPGHAASKKDVRENISLWRHQIHVINVLWS